MKAQDYKIKIEDFNKRWQISNNLKYGDEYEKFRVRILNSFQNIDKELMESEVKFFCNVLGITYHSPNHGDVYITLKQTTNEKEFYRILQLLLVLPVSRQHNIYTGKPTFSRDTIIQRIVVAIELSKVNLAYVKNGDEILLYPAGEKILDQKLVDEVMSFLNNTDNEHFGDALKFYEQSKSIKSAESLRRSLEEFLRFKLGNTKGLDNNIVELSKKLKEAKIDSKIRNIIFTAFNSLDQYFNENSKHKDGNITEAENEFLIYQIGLLMRYINKLIIDFN